MSNEMIRDRIKKYTAAYPVSLARIGRDAGLGAPSRYIISRFLRGVSLDVDTLAAIDKYLLARGF